MTTNQTKVYQLFKEIFGQINFSNIDVTLQANSNFKTIQYLLTTQTPDITAMLNVITIYLNNSYNASQIANIYFNLGIITDVTNPNFISNSQNSNSVPNNSFNYLSRSLENANYFSSIEPSILGNGNNILDLQKYTTINQSQSNDQAPINNNVFSQNYFSDELYPNIINPNQFLQYSSQVPQYLNQSPQYSNQMLQYSNQMPPQYSNQMPPQYSNQMPPQYLNQSPQYLNQVPQYSNQSPQYSQTFQNPQMVQTPLEESISIQTPLEESPSENPLENPSENPLENPSENPLENLSENQSQEFQSQESSNQSVPNFESINIDLNKKIINLQYQLNLLKSNSTFDCNNKIDKASKNLSYQINDLKTQGTRVNNNYLHLLFDLLLNNQLITLNEIENINKKLKNGDIDIYTIVSLLERKKELAKISFPNFNDIYLKKWTTPLPRPPICLSDNPIKLKQNDIYANNYSVFN
jgi:hypothetical protein